MPAELTERFPELATINWRRGGLPLRIGGWLLGRSSVSGITLWNTVMLAEGAESDVELLLHEARHTEQYRSDAFFPLRYLWGSLRYGYTNNPYEIDARNHAAKRSGP